MNDTLVTKCDLLASNRSVIAKKFSAETNLMCVTSGLLFALEDREADAEKLDGCRKILKKQTVVFSKLRGMAEMLIVSRMAMSEDPEEYLNDSVTVYEKVKTAGFKDNSFIIPACMTICDLGLKDDCGETLLKAKEIMKLMNREHPVLTNDEDSSAAILMALSYKDAETAVKDLEEGFDYLRKTYHLGISKNAGQSLCEILAVTYGDMKSKCDRIARIYKAFKKQKSSYGNDDEFSTLAILGDIDADPTMLAGEVIETAKYLEEKDGFADKIIEKQQRMMYSTLLVANAHGKNDEMTGGPVIGNTISIITAKRKAALISLTVQLATNILPAIAGVSDTGSSGAGEMTKISE